MSSQNQGQPLAEVIYPIAEIFDSVQGEGLSTGQPMTFVRLAGCNVGKYLKAGEKQAICVTIDGTTFQCDTDYRLSCKLSLHEILTRAKHRHICLTGGEPFLHDLAPFIKLCVQWGKYLHIETSGTFQIDIPDGSRANVWITCCPKAGFLDTNYYYPNEWKFLIGASYITPEHIETLLDKYIDKLDSRPVFLQPVNYTTAVNTKILKMITEFISRRTSRGPDDWRDVRISVQLHKILEVR